MDWWGWVLVVVVVMAAVFAFFEWRSRNKPLGRGLQDDIGLHDYPGNSQLPPTWRSDLEKPRD